MSQVESVGGPVDQVSENAGSCVCCGSTRLNDFFHVDRIPVHVGILHDNRDAALDAPMGDVTLSYCSACGMIHNRRFDSKVTDFKPGYEVALHHSKVFRDFTEGVARRLVEKHGLRGETVFEIGCGDGFFLRTLCQLGVSRGIGVDPTVMKEGTTKIGEASLELIRDFYTDRFIDQECDFVCCLSVFEDIERPIDFLDRVRRMIGQRDDIPVYFEVFNGYRAFEQLETWSVHYEQCNYFSLESLKNAFLKGGFKLLDAGTCYEGDQYLYVEAKPDRPQDTHASSGNSQNDLPDTIAQFSQHYLDAKKAWTDRFDEFRCAGNRVVLWGSGGKGISFLNAIDSSDVIQHVVEINPDKQGKYIPGSGQQIVPPQFMADFQPEKIIITNPLYEREMKHQAAALGVHADFYVA